MCVTLEDGLLVRRELQQRARERESESESEGASEHSTRARVLNIYGCIRVNLVHSSVTLQQIHPARSTAAVALSPAHGSLH